MKWQAWEHEGLGRGRRALMGPVTVEVVHAKECEGATALEDEAWNAELASNLRSPRVARATDDAARGDRLLSKQLLQGLPQKLGSVVEVGHQVHGG